VTATELVYEAGNVVATVGLDRNGVVRTRTLIGPHRVHWLDSVGRPRQGHPSLGVSTKVPLNVQAEPSTPP